VIHLWRKGSAAPYTRILNGLLASEEDGGVGFEALGKLFDGQEDTFVADDDDINAYENNDPWLTSTTKKSSSRANNKKKTRDAIRDDDDEDSDAGYSSDRGETKLSRRILNSTVLRCKLRERAHVLKEGLLLTIPFRTVEEYLGKLQLCAESIRDCRSLGLVYLAAAVSDFYIPEEQRCKHKIQSRDYGLSGGKGDDDDDDDDANDTKNNAHGNKSAIQLKGDGEGITIHLSPVPKCLSLLRETWAPDAFCVSFKLETDKNILHDKAKMAMDRYGVHVVIGNLLSTRHEKVWILQRKDGDDGYPNHDYTTATSVSGTTTTANDDDGSLLEMLELSNGRNGTNKLASASSDELEDSIISHIVERHFSYIATNHLTGNHNNSFNTTNPLMAGAEAAARHNLHLQEKKRKLQKEIYWNKVQDVGLQLAGHAIGMYLTYVLSSGLQRRMR